MRKRPNTGDAKIATRKSLIKHIYQRLYQAADVCENTMPITVCVFSDEARKIGKKILSQRPGAYPLSKSETYDLPQPLGAYPLSIKMIKGPPPEGVTAKEFDEDEFLFG